MCFSPQLHNEQQTEIMKKKEASSSTPDTLKAGRRGGESAHNWPHLQANIICFGSAASAIIQDLFVILKAQLHQFFKKIPFKKKALHGGRQGFQKHFET